MKTELTISPAPPTTLFTPTPKAARRLLEFFTAPVNNGHTRKGYFTATRRFAARCDAHLIGQLIDVEAFHIAAFVKDLQGEFSAPTVKQRLAALCIAVRLACNGLSCTPLEIEPPIREGRGDRRGGKWQTNDRRKKGTAGDKHSPGRDGGRSCAPDRTLTPWRKCRRKTHRL
jgi:hypothetical protein